MSKVRKCVVLIPTHARLKAVERTLQSLEKYIAGSTIDFVIFVSNNNKTGNLKDSIDELALQSSAIIAHPPYFASGNEHLIWMIENIPLEADWYWFFGDDDEIDLTSKSEIEHLLSLDQIDYIHATDAKINLTERTAFGPLQYLAKHYGVLELFSFWSSQIISHSTLTAIRASLKETALRSVFFDKSHPSASFAMSALLLAVAPFRAGAITRSPSIHSSHTPAEAPSGDITFWFRIHQHFCFLASLGLIASKENRNVFFHHRQPIWCKQALWVLGPLLNGKPLTISYYFDEILKVFNSVVENQDVRTERLLLNLSAEITRSLEAGLDEAARQSSLRQLLLIYNELMRSQ